MKRPASAKLRTPVILLKSLAEDMLSAAGFSPFFIALLCL